MQTFGKLYVRTGLIAAEFGRRLNQHLELRNKARYDLSVTKICWKTGRKLGNSPLSNNFWSHSYDFHARIVRDDAQEAIDLATAMTGILEEALEQEEPR